MKIIRLYCSVPDCNKSFRSEEQLASHLRTHLDEEEISEEQNKFECEICFHKFPTKRSVSAHKRVHKHQLNSNYAPQSIDLLTRKLVTNRNSDIPTTPEEFNIEEITLPPIVGPKPAILPEFYSIFKINSN